MDTKFRAQTRDLELWPSPWVSMAELWVLHIVPRVNIWPKLEKILPGVKEIQSGHEFQGLNPWPWTVTLTLSQHDWDIDSAHRLTKVNIWPKFKENPSTAIGYIERNSRLKPCDLRVHSISPLTLDLVSAWLSYEFCILSHWGKHMTKV